MKALAHKINGWIAVDKPAGMTSNKVLMMLRRHFGRVKAGYAGTLDPFATGMLPIAFGEATKLMDYMVDTAKVYHFTVRWGESTDTDDCDGQVIKTHDHRPTDSDIKGALDAFQGTIEQTPPKYSAIKIQGKRACDRVRNQEEVVMKARKVSVESFDLVRMVDADHAEFRVRCGKGTYIRSLARDLGAVLGTCAHVTTLRRESVGVFSEPQALNYEKLLELKGLIELQQFVHPMDIVLDDIPAITIGEQEVKKIRHGQSISCPKSLGDFSNDDAPLGVQLKDHSRQLVAMSFVKQGTLCPNRVFVY